VHGVVRLRIIDLVQWLWDEFVISIGKQVLDHELWTMGYRKLDTSKNQRFNARAARGVLIAALAA
jgi:hypothetical protein